MKIKESDIWTYKGQRFCGVPFEEGELPKINSYVMDMKHLRIFRVGDILKFGYAGEGPTILVTDAYTEEQDFFSIKDLRKIVKC